MTAQAMVNEINTIIDNTAGNRFTQSEIIATINQGLRDIADKAELYNKVYIVPLSNDEIYYRLPDDVFKISRAEYMNKPLPILSQGELDAKYPGWSAKTSTRVEALVSHLYDYRYFRLYPVPLDVERMDTETENSLGGGLANLINNGVVFVEGGEGAEDAAGAVVGSEGALIDIQIPQVLRLFCKRLPKNVTDLSEEVDIPAIYANAPIYYSAGNLLINSGRTEDINKGQAFLAKYAKEELRKIRTRTSMLHNTSKSNTIQYSTPFGG